ncbi:MAG: diiron oxygenase [Bacteroidota bacterium]
MPVATQLTDQQVERLIRISKEKPLIPEEYIPWDVEPGPDQLFLPEKVVSSEGLPFYDQLTPQQKRDLGRHEMVQVMYSYAWSEGLFCLFINRHILDLSPDTLEYRFLVRELIEEFRHQDMFANAIDKLDGKPILPGRQHRFWGKMTVKYLPAAWVFMSGLSVELITDVYGKMIRRDKQVYEVLRKVSELHHIEEGRHIVFTQAWLNQYTAKANLIQRSWYSIIVMFNIFFMRTLYVKQEIFERIGVENPKECYRQARKHFKQRFADVCLKEAIEFVESWRGFNALTRPLWRWFLAAKV